ncbi:hypothetical protein F4604DRAFT_1727622 [Suillus subluteus]|nr:hypothetical protein F4604DRAFT_1727622 [Suillus subluteus]
MGMTYSVCSMAEHDRAHCDFLTDTITDTFLENSNNTSSNRTVTQTAKVSDHVLCSSRLLLSCIQVTLRLFHSQQYNHRTAAQTANVSALLHSSHMRSTMFGTKSYSGSFTTGSQQHTAPARDASKSCSGPCISQQRAAPEGSRRHPSPSSPLTQVSRVPRVLDERVSPSSAVHENATFLTIVLACRAGASVSMSMVAFESTNYCHCYIIRQPLFFSISFLGRR